METVTSLPRRLHARAVFQWVASCRSQPFILTNRSALIIAPHQDDETLGCGGLIALNRERNVPVHVAFLTDGALGRSAADASGIAAFVRLRNTEAVNATGTLGLDAAAVSFLGYPDASLSHLAEYRRAELIGRLCELLDRYQPDEVYVTHRSDCHPDHEAAYALTSAAVREMRGDISLYEYSIWMAWSAPMFLRLKSSWLAGARVLDICRVLHKKRQAISAYASQTATLPSGFLDRFLLPQEIFFSRDTHHVA